ncbi:hypothetical protein BD779DRAFT_1487503 [Infundibulicybe gibba]|nr:hypothetical protein BD779DRAFT_1487503 [Infundibulicybe gibba]
MVHVPLELVELIFEQLNSKPALRACALVCKAWLPTALRFLFHRLTLNLDPRSTRPLDIWRTHLAFPHYVREFTIMMMDGPRPAELKDAIPLFDRVGSLKLWVLHYDFILHLPHTHLYKLDLHFISFPNFRSFQVFVSAFPHLEVLSTHHIDQDGSQLGNIDGHLGDVHPPPRLRVLKYNAAGVYRVPFFRWLSAHPPTLEHLTLTKLCSDEYESAGALLCALGPCLRTFKVSFNRVNMALAHPLLHANTHLHTLCITLSQGSIKSPGVPVLLTLLGSANPALRCVTLELLDVYHYFPEDELRALDATLTHAPSLECLHIGVHTLFYSNLREFDRAAREYMPYCSENGILAGVNSLDVRDHNRTRTPAHGKLQRILLL